MRLYTFLISFVVLLTSHAESDEQISKKNELLMHSNIEKIKKKYPVKKVNKKTFGLANKQRSDVNPRKNSKPGQVLGVSAKEPKQKTKTFLTANNAFNTNNSSSGTPSTKNFMSENNDDFDDTDDLSDEEIEELLNTMFNS
jgi:hypothetical protein